MALGWPVMEKGLLPGRPMRLVARWQLMMLLTLSVPEVDWGHGFVGIGKPLEKGLQVPGGDIQPLGQCRRIPGIVDGCGQGVGELLGVRLDVVFVHGAVAGQMRQHAIEQGHVGARVDGQVQIRQIAGIGAARVDDHYFHFRALLFRDFDALVQHRVAPGQVGAGENQQVGQLQVGVAAGHCVAAKGAFVAGYTGRHTQARIGVDIAAANKALHHPRSTTGRKRKRPPSRDRARQWYRQNAGPLHSAPRPRSVARRPPGGATGARCRPRFHPAPCLWSTAGRSSPGGSHRPQWSLRACRY